MGRFIARCTGCHWTGTLCSTPSPQPNVLLESDDSSPCGFRARCLQAAKRTECDTTTACISRPDNCYPPDLCGGPIVCPAQGTRARNHPPVAPRRTRSLGRRRRRSARARPIHPERRTCQRGRCRRVSGRRIPLPRLAATHVTHVTASVAATRPSLVHYSCLLAGVGLTTVLLLLCPRPGGGRITVCCHAICPRRLCVPRFVVRTAAGNSGNS